VAGYDIEAALGRIRQAVVDQSYVMSVHALLEMREDRLDLIDVESAILTGTIERVFEDDPRGSRYEIVGKACDLTADVGVVVRFAGPVLIITIYEITE
jgi:Domain of unknown function (DUF4258)